MVIAMSIGEGDVALRKAHLPLRLVMPADAVWHVTVAAPHNRASKIGENIGANTSTLSRVFSRDCDYQSLEGK